MLNVERTVRGLAQGTTGTHEQIACTNQAVMLKQ